VTDVRQQPVLGNILVSIQMATLVLKLVIQVYCMYKYYTCKFNTKRWHIYHHSQITQQSLLVLSINVFMLLRKHTLIQNFIIHK
jgi:hypothetical protein